MQGGKEERKVDENTEIHVDHQADILCRANCCR